MRHLRLFALLLLFLIACPLSAADADDLLIQAKQQLDNGNAQEAYNLLIPLQSVRAGDPGFDFLLGSAAIALGKNTEAVFALERVLAVRPDSSPARALIARAYFNLKETEAAKREFENVKKQDVPPEVSATIDRFLDAIQGIEETQKITIHGYFMFGSGYDSNVNSATSDSAIAVPLYSGQLFTLSQSSRRQADGFFTFGGSVGLIAPVTKQFVIFGNIAYTNQTNFQQSLFDTYSYDANLGASYKFDRDVVTLAAQFNAFYLDNLQLYNDSYRNAAGGVLKWQHDFNASNQVSAFVQAVALRFPSQSPMNVDRYVAGAGYAHAFVPKGPVVYLGAYGGQEREVDEQFPQWGSDIAGARMGAQQFISEKYSVYLNANAEHRKYHGKDPLFLETREDNLYTASFGMNFVPKKNVRITPEVLYTKNQSNISIYGFDRWIAQLIFRQDM